LFELLIDNNEINARDNNGDTPLHMRGASGRRFFRRAPTLL
jgi:ankyrin repeat protein